MTNSKQGVCTHIIWGANTEISEDFFKACCPAQVSENYMLVNSPVETVRKIADRVGQKGLMMEPGTWSQ